MMCTVLTAMALKDIGHSHIPFSEMTLGLEKPVIYKPEMYRNIIHIIVLCRERHRLAKMCRNSTLGKPWLEAIFKCSTSSRELNNWNKCDLKVNVTALNEIKHNHQVLLVTADSH